MQKSIPIALLLFVESLCVFASNVSISISAPKEVGIGEQFQISYEIGSQNISNFEMPNFDGFHLLNRHQSSSSSTTIINGQVSTKSSTTFTFILSATKEGNLIIGPAKVHINGETYTTKSVPIHVVDGVSMNQSTNAPPSASSSNIPSQHTQPYPQTHNDPTGLSDNDLFVRAIASKTKAYEQEAILLTYKIYASQHLYVTGFQGKLPTLNGFHIQEIEPEREQRSETYNGKTYNTAVWKQYVIYPQSSGTNTIPSIQCEATLSVPNGYMDPWGMFPRTDSQIKMLQSNPLTIHVKALPDNAPDSFYGGVGDFNISTSINKRKLKSSDIVTLTVNITGQGNLKLIETPKIDFPQTFETYDCKVTDDYVLTSSGHEGSKIFEYRAVPQKGGKYTIPSLKFSYFSPESNTYKTLSSPSYQLTVESDPNHPSQVEVDQLDQDIKHIKLGKTELHKNNFQELYSWKWIVGYVSVIIVFTMLFIAIYRDHHLKMNQSENKRHATRLAKKQLEKSHQLLDKSQVKDFYIELLNALNSFPQNKLNISNEDFNKDSINKILEIHHVPNDVIDEYLSLVEACERTRYSSQESSSDSESDYNKAVDIISKLDNCLK